MDPIKILKRAWHILWNYRALWVFGLVLALTAGGASNSISDKGRYTTDSQEWQQQYQTTIPESFQQSFEQAMQELKNIFEHGLPSAGITHQEITTLVWVLVILFVLGMLFSVAMAFARYVSETAVIKMVDNYEETGEKIGVRAGFKLGWSRTSWRLFLINLIISLPVLILVITMLVGGLAVFVNFVRNSTDFAIASLIGTIGLLFVLFMIVAILSVILSLLRNFFWRAAALEDLGVGDSFRRGWEMVRSNFKDVGLMWLVMIGLGIAWVIVSAIFVILTIPLLIITGAVAVVISAVPFLIAVGLSSLVLSGPLPWIVGALFTLPIFLPIAFSPWVAIGGLEKIFTSSVWTLVYRELNALPEQPVEVVAAEA